MLSAGVLMGMMAEIDLPITDEIFRADFLGRSFANAAVRAEVRFGRPMPEDFQLRYRDRLLTRMREALQPMPGVFGVLDAMAVPYWLATSSSPQRLAVSLEVTGLAPHFKGRCSTASEVTRGKPEPDRSSTWRLTWRSCRAPQSVRPAHALPQATGPCAQPDRRGRD